MTEAGHGLGEDEVAGLGPNMRYGLACKWVAENAPLRVLPGEKVVGAATLLEAARHAVPVLGVSSTSHTTLGFAGVLEYGYEDYRKRIEERLARGDVDERGRDLLEAMKLCLLAADVWHRRHMDELKRLADAEQDEAVRDQYLSVMESLRNVPAKPAQTFREAVQSLWFTYAFQRLMGTWSGIGRIDEMLGPYLERDLDAGRITLDEARELVAHFWIKGCEWIGANPWQGSGDAQHYQNIILSGVNAQGRDITNEVTYLVLDVVEELHISDFPIAVRLNQNSPRRLLEKIASVQRHGGGIVALYNEEVVIEGLCRFGYELEEARTFSNDGCWEVIIPGRTAFSYGPFDALGLLQKALRLDAPREAVPEFAGFESLYSAFLDRLAAHLDAHNAGADNMWRGDHPAPLVSILVEDCIDRARGYNDRGTRYAVFAPHAGGLADVANSLLVLKRLVYEDQLVSLDEFVEVLRRDWRDQEHFRAQIRNRFEFYGNDAEDADAMMQRVFNDYTELVARVKERNGCLRPAGISTFGREIEWAPVRTASPCGAREGDVLATNFSPSPGTDRHGPTAALQSYCKMDFTRCPNGATVELKVHPSGVKGRHGITALAGLMRSFVRLGGFFMHIDVVDTEMLRDAQEHPEKYPNLSVRISGWSARFATLNRDWQNMVINRTQQYV
jgi:formate C-acetyltransferase